ncbi:MAG TPA: Flp pilus assembly protein CpaB [Vicinamibacterales bacterium]|nr:Flp pilus assembly protein CpaB [Vicinamibacterales bacterium]
MALRLPRLRINRTWLMLFVAVLLGLAATWLMMQYLKGREQRMAAELSLKAKGGPATKVVVATRDLPRGTVISSSMMAGREISSDLVYSETITVDMFDKFEGAKLVRAVERGRPLRTSDMEEKGKDFSDTLGPGLRAITVETDELNSIAQMVKPGNMVDLYLILPDTKDLSGNNQQIVLFMQRVKVIATGQRVSKGEPVSQPGMPQGVVRYGNLTFEVTPDTAARIALAQQLGKIRAVLRPEPDDGVVKLGRINTKNLLRKTTFLKEDPLVDPVERDEAAVEYIIGGRGASGVGNTITVNVPGLAPGTAAGASPGVPGQAVPGAPAGPAMGVPAGIPPAAAQYFPAVPLPPAQK